MTLDFPSTPTIGLTTSISDKTWEYNGKGWKLLPNQVQGIQGTTGAQGILGSQGVQGASVQGSQGVQGASVQGVQGLVGPIAGSNTQVIFNNNNVSAGATNFVYDATNQRVGIGTTNAINTLTVTGSGTSTSQFFVVGVSTHVGVSTFNNQVGVNGGLSVVGSGVTSTTLNIIGFSTISSALIVSGTGVTATTLRVTGVSTVTGISTFGSQVGVVGGLTVSGTGVTATTLNITGVSTFAGIATHTASLFGIQANFTGVVTATDFNSTSDFNLKTNIKIIQNPLDTVLQLRGVTFDWKSSGRPSIGIVAQEVEKVLPELVTNTDPRTVNYNGLIGVVIEAIKEQQDQINSLKEEIQLLKNQ